MPGDTTQIARSEIELRFQNKPLTDEQKEVIETITPDFLEVAISIQNNTPDGREKALALTHLESSLFYARAAIERRS